MVVAFVLVVLRAEVLESGAEFVLKQILNYHFAGNGLLELSCSGLLDNFIKIFIFEGRPHLFLFDVVL